MLTAATDGCTRLLPQLDQDPWDEALALQDYGAVQAEVVRGVPWSMSVAANAALSSLTSFLSPFYTLEQLLIFLLWPLSLSAILSMGVCPCSHLQGSSFLTPFPSSSRCLAAILRRKQLLSLLVPQPPISWVFLLRAAPVFSTHSWQCSMERGWVFICLLYRWQALPLPGKGVHLQ